MDSEPKVKDKVDKKDKIYPLECPICDIATNNIYCLKDGKDTAEWYTCNCGVIFQKDKPEHNVYNEEYIAPYKVVKNSNLVQIHAARTYIHLIEELTYGRKMLEVGFNLPDNMNYFRERGWIVTGIDINETFKNKQNIIIGDFEKYDFKIEYDLVWMSHVFEHFNEPLKILKKVYDMLSYSGVLYLSTPDIEFINKTGVSEYPHWKKYEHYVMWSQRALVRELERIGFNVIMKRRNFSSRFTSWYDCQILAQKRFF